MEGFIRRGLAGLHVFFVFLVFGVLSGCTENLDLFSSLDETEGPVLQTLAVGEVVTPDSFLSIQLTYPEEDMSRATELNVTLVDMDGEIIGETTFSDDLLLQSQLPKVELPNPVPGSYLLRVSAYRGEEVLLFDERQFFVMETPPAFDSVTVYPSAVEADSDAVAVADVAVADGTRPYLVWYFRDRVVGEGYVDAGSEKIVFSPGGAIGVHPIVVDLYPWGPEEGVDITKPTTISAGTEVFIRSAARETRAAGSTILQYPFDGRRTPVVDAVEGEFRAIEVNDGVTLDVEKERLGYRLYSGGTVKIPYEIVPDVGDAVRLNVRFAWSDVPSVQGNESDMDTFILAFGGDDNTSIRIRIGRDGSGDIETAVTPSEPYRTGTNSFGAVRSEWINLSLLLVHDEDGLFLIPQSEGRPYSVFPVVTGEEVPFVDFPEMTFEGPGSILMELFEVAVVKSVQDYFDSEYSTFFFHHGGRTQDRPIRSAFVDLAVEQVHLSLPEDHYFLVLSRDNVSQFLVWRDAETVYLLDPEGAGYPVDSFDSYSDIVSNRVVSTGLSLATGIDYALSDDGVITVPDAIGSELYIVSGRLADHGNGAVIATVSDS